MDKKVDDASYTLDAEASTLSPRYLHSPTNKENLSEFIIAQTPDFWIKNQLKVTNFLGTSGYDVKMTEGGMGR